MEGQGIEAETPSWSLVVKPILPRALCKDESKTTKHPSSVVMTHGGEEGRFEIFENSMSHQSFKEETHVGETNRDRHETQTHMLMVTRLGGAQKKESKKKTY